MTYLGTRPILPDELEQYELHHRARIAIKPGITGMWQVSGRSDITDFEEIVRLDTEYISYIDSWNQILGRNITDEYALAKARQENILLTTNKKNWTRTFRSLEERVLNCKRKMN